MPDVFASVCRLATLKSFVLVLVMLGAIEAFAQQPQSRQLAGKWTETDKLDSNARYWKRFPTGDEIVKCWKQLLGRN